MDEIEELRKLVGVLASKIDDLEMKIKGETLTLEEFVENQPDVFRMPLRSTA